MRIINDKFCNRSYLITKMVRLLDKLWNHFSPCLYDLQGKLERAGLSVLNDEVVYIENKENGDV